MLEDILAAGREEESPDPGLGARISHEACAEIESEGEPSAEDSEEEEKLSPEAPALP